MTSLVKSFEDLSPVERSRVNDSKQLPIDSTVFLAFKNTLLLPHLTPSFGNEKNWLPGVNQFQIQIETDQYEKDSFEGAAPEDPEEKSSEVPQFSICSKIYPNLVLDIAFESAYADPADGEAEDPAEGQPEDIEGEAEAEEKPSSQIYEIKLSMKGHDPYSPSTGWSFTPDGNIINSHLVGYGLTRTNTGPIVMKKLRKRNKNQVWAIKNKSKQWEKTTLNSYRRDALCWPIMPDGTLNQGLVYFLVIYSLLMSH